ncbi:MAG: VWA domain-containing protein [Acidobacteriota bacterium]|nr:VWA domain-containing protein [Acidobacteriota bacterium]
MEPQTEEAFFETVDVTVVNVDVYVTDKKGNPVSGLTAEDFEVYEDNRRMKISNFYAVQDGLQVRTQQSAQGIPIERLEQAPERPALERLPLAEDQRLHLVVYFDNLYLRPFNRNKAIDSVRRFLARNLGDDDQAMLVTFERSLNVRHPFTKDLGSFNRALDGLLKLSGFAVQAASERHQVIKRIDGSDSAFEAQGFADFYAKQVYNDTGNSIDGLKEIVASLGGLPGRKALLYVSDGIPMTAGEDLFYLVDLKYQNSGQGGLQAARYRIERRFTELTSQANANRVTFYTLGATGLRSHASLSAEYGGSLDGTSYAEVDFLRQSNETATLDKMARDTGGISVHGTNNLDGALDTFSRDFRSFYSLGYQAAHGGDGRYYRIRVKTTRKDLEVRHRTGYRAKRAHTVVTEGTLAALLYRREANPLEIRFEFETPQQKEDKQYLVPLVVHIPIGKLSLVPLSELYNGRLKVTVAVIDEKGRLSPVDLQTVPVNIPKADIAQAIGQDYVYAVELVMRAGAQEVAVGVHDEISSKTSYVRKRLRVGS